MTALGSLMRRDLSVSRREAQDRQVVLSTGSDLINRVRHWLTTPADRPAAWVSEPGQLDEVLDEAGVSQLEIASRIFRDCDERQPGGLRRQAVVGQLYETSELLEDPHPEEITRRLFGTVAELATLVGSMSHEQGLDDTAQKYFLLALHAARQAGNETLCGEIVSRMARQMVHLGYPRDALALINCVRQISKHTASANVRSLFLLVEAWSYAHLGEVEDCHRAIREAQEAFADYRPGEEPELLSFETADVIGMAGHAYRVLSEHDPNQTTHAEPLIRQALSLRNPDNARDRALDLIDLAMTYLMRQEPDHACVAGEEILKLVDRLHLSAYVLTQLRTLRIQTERYERRYGSSPALRRLVEKLAGLDPDCLEPDCLEPDYTGATITASIPGPACAPTTAPTSLR